MPYRGVYSKIRLWGAIASLILAVAMAVMVALGLRHARRAGPDEELLAAHA